MVCVGFICGWVISFAIVVDAGADGFMHLKLGFFLLFFLSHHSTIHYLQVVGFWVMN